MKIKKNLVKAVVISILLYGCEIWDIEKFKPTLNEFSRLIKRKIYDQIDNFQLKIEDDDIDVYQMALNKRQNFLEKIKHEKTSPAYQSFNKETSTR